MFVMDFPLGYPIPSEKKVLMEKKRTKEKIFRNKKKMKREPQKRR